MDMKSLLDKMTQLSQVDEEKKSDFLDLDKDGDKKEPMKKAAKEKDDDKEKVDEAIAVQADGQEAMALLDILKLSGQKPMSTTIADTSLSGGGAEISSPDLEMSVSEDDPSFANTPANGSNTMVAGMDSAIPSGNGLDRPKKMTKHGYQQGDNPLAMAEVAAMEGKLTKMFEALSKE